MDDIARTSPAPGTDTGHWMVRLLIAVILGEGIWGLIVSLTNNLILPFLARIMGTDARSPLSLGNGQFNVPGLFTSVLELCFAGIVAVILNSWIQRKPKPTRSKPVRVTPIPVQPAAPRPSPLAVVPVQAPEPAPQPAPIAVPATATATPAAPAPDGNASRQANSGRRLNQRPRRRCAHLRHRSQRKPKPPREIVYNSVGDPLPFDDDE